MLDQLPHRALLRFEVPVHYMPRAPRLDGGVAKWSRYLAPPLIELDGQPAFADVYWGWNEDGFYAAFDVPNRSGPPRCDTQAWWKLDGVRLCIDTRDARENKRATRFCHFFYVLPTGGGRNREDPIVGTHRMSRAKEPPPAVDVEKIRVASHVESRRYMIELAIPGECLNGWNPAEHPRIGLFYKVKDTRLGEQHLSATDDLGWNADPSTWATGVLVR
ncbi:MAG: hypothetical protein HZB38_11250 [Planctomycetes bacterium]|nr:hypothetical protein [Planctomycetota bacterium]